MKGLPSLREAVAAHHQRTFGIECSAEDVLIGPGSKELMFLLQLTYDGDLVVPTPSWVSYVPQAKIIGRRVHLLPTSKDRGWQLTAEQLDELCSRTPNQSRIVVLNYPSNPNRTDADTTAAFRVGRGGGQVSSSAAFRRNLRQDSSQRTAQLSCFFLPVRDHLQWRPKQMVWRRRLAIGRLRVS